MKLKRICNIFLYIRMGFHFRGFLTVENVGYKTLIKNYQLPSLVMHTFQPFIIKNGKIKKKKPGRFGKISEDFIETISAI